MSAALRARRCLRDSFIFNSLVLDVLSSARLTIRRRARLCFCLISWFEVNEVIVIMQE